MSCSEEETVELDTIFGIISKQKFVEIVSEFSETYIMYVTCIAKGVI
jgi:hypothetical protein